MSKLLSVVFRRHRTPAFFAVAGLSLGSFATMFFNPEMKSVYSGWSAGADAVRDIVVGAILFAVGATAAYLLVRYERRHKRGDGNVSDNEARRCG